MHCCAIWNLFLVGYYIGYFCMQQRRESMDAKMSHKIKRTAQKILFPHI